MDDDSIQSSVHRVQLTLDDLSYSEADHMSATTDTGSVSRPTGESNRGPQDYKRELTKLLRKSRGTPYEKTLRKFVESKLREISHDIQNNKSRSVTPTSNRHPSSPEPYKIDLLSLSRSKYDSPKRGGETIHQAIPDEELSRLRIEELSKPLDRNRYQGVYDSRITTNHIGRQRPPAKIEDRRSSVSPSRASIVTSSTIRHQSNPNSPLRRSQELLETPNSKVPMQEFWHWLRRNRRWDQSAKNKMETNRERILTEFSESSKPRITKKSIKLAELAQNRESLEYLRLQEFLRQEKQQQRNEPVSPTDHSLRSGNPDHYPTSSIAAGGLHEYFPKDDPNVDVDSLLKGSLGNDVFERLSARGKIHAERKRLLQEREQAMNIARHSFAPQLAPNTENFAQNFYRRKLGTEDTGSDNDRRSRSRSREYLLGRLTTSTASSRSISRERASSSKVTAASAPGRPQSAPSTRAIHTNTNNISASASSLKPMQRSSSPPLPSNSHNNSTSIVGVGSSPQKSLPVSRRSKTREEVVAEDIAKVRSKSRERRDLQLQQEMKRQYLIPGSTTGSSAASVHASGTAVSSARTSHAAISSSEEPLAAALPSPRPFTPTLCARNTTNQLVKSSFEERNAIAVERKILRKVLSSREPSPGPGQYRGIEVKQDLSSPPKRGAQHVHISSAVSSASAGSESSAAPAAAVAERFQSPGSRGYSFGKSPLRSSIISTAYSHEDVNKLTYQAIKQQPVNTSTSVLLRSPRVSMLVSAATGGANVGLAASYQSNTDKDDGVSTSSHAKAQPPATVAGTTSSAAYRLANSSSSLSPPPPPAPSTQHQMKSRSQASTKEQPPAASLTSMLSPTAYHI